MPQPIDDTQLRQLLAQGLSQREISRQTGIPRATLYKHFKRLGLAPVQSGADMHGAQPVQNRAGYTTVHGAVQVQNSTELPIPAALATELTRFWAAIDALRNDMHRPVHDTVQSLPEPLFEDPEDNTTERWNLYLKRGLRVRLEAMAKARGVAPSRLVQEILWKALHLEG